MKTAIIYYSQSGNANFVANEMVKHLDADIVRIEPSKAYPDKGFKKFFWGGKSAVMGESPALVPYKFDADKYDVVVIGYPVWASTFAPPIRSFVEQNKASLQSKKIVAFATSSGGNAEKSFVKLANLLKGWPSAARFPGGSRRGRNGKISRCSPPPGCTGPRRTIPAREKWSPCRWIRPSSAP